MKILIVVVAFGLLIAGYLLWQHALLKKIETISLPPAPAPRAAEAFALTVVVTGKGQFTANDVPMDLEQVKKVIAGTKWDDHTALKVKRGPGAPFEEVVVVLDYGRRCGVVQVSVE